MDDKERRELKADIRAFQQVLDTQKRIDPDSAIITALEEAIQKRKDQLRGSE